MLRKGKPIVSLVGESSEIDDELIPPHDLFIQARGFGHGGGVQFVLEDQFEVRIETREVGAVVEGGVGAHPLTIQVFVELIQWNGFFDADRRVFRGLIRKVIRREFLQRAEIGEGKTAAFGEDPFVIQVLQIFAAI